MVQLNADLSSVEEQQPFDCLAPAWYPAEVVDSEIKEGPKGMYINWTWQILGKPNKVFDIMSLTNEISMSRLKSMAIACRHPNPQFVENTDDLHGKPCQVRLKIEKDPSGQYSDKNKITGFRDIDFTATSSESKATIQPNAITQKQIKMPWEK